MLLACHRAGEFAFLNQLCLQRTGLGPTRHINAKKRQQITLRITCTKPRYENAMRHHQIQRGVMITRFMRQNTLADWCADIV
jgi:hypothetical protein